MKKLFTLLTSLMLCISMNASAQDIQIKRLNGEEPIITKQMFVDAGAMDTDGDNINGMSVIRIPDWISKDKRAAPNAKYYMYFANHIGTYIRMAWAEKVEGPWTLYNVSAELNPTDKGVLALSTEVSKGKFKPFVRVSPELRIENHVASPAAIVDNENKRIILYFHAGDSFIKDATKDVSPQRTYISHSADGLDFNGNIAPAMLGGSYFAPFAYKGDWYAMGNNGTFNIAPKDKDIWNIDPKRDVEEFFWASGSKMLRIHLNKYCKEKNISPVIYPRHCGVYVDGDILYVVYSAKDDSPERIYYSTIDLSKGDHSSWVPEGVKIIMQAEKEWEGADLDAQLARKGRARTELNDVRDPHIFKDKDGSLYLFYAGGGERAIGVAAMKIK